MARVAPAASGGVASHGSSIVPGTENEASPLRGGPMRPSHPTSLAHYLVAAIEEDRYRGIERRNAHHRALLEARAERPSLRARLGAAILNIVRRDHSLTDYPCRLPDGNIGRVAVIRVDADWSLVCRVA